VSTVGSSCAVCLALLWLVSDAGRSASAPRPSTVKSARIAFASHRDGNWEVYVMDADGARTHLTTDPGYDLQFAWSPDGARLVFLSARDGVDGAVWVMRASDGAARRLTADPALNPIWMP